MHIYISISLSLYIYIYRYRERRQKNAEALWWHYLSNATCLMRPHVFLLRHHSSNTET